MRNGFILGLSMFLIGAIIGLLISVLIQAQHPY